MILRPPRSPLFTYTPLFRSLDQGLARTPKLAHDAGNIYLTPRVVGLFERADAEANRLKDEFVDVEHLLIAARSEEHTSELQSRQYLVCRLLLEKKNEDKVII